MNEISKHLNANTKKWLLSATPENIAKVLELGYMRANIDIPLSSVYKGKNGEEYICEILKEKNYNNTTKDGKSGDIMINTNNGKIMIEVKDYTRNVNKDEIKKFHRDLMAHSEVNGGIFISLNSGISGIKEKFLYKMESILGREIPIIYICANDPDVINIGFDILITHLDAKIQVIHDQTELVNRINSLSEYLSGLSNSRLQIDEFREDCNRSLDKLYKTILVCEVSLKDHIDSIKNILKVDTHCKHIADTKKAIKYFKKTLLKDSQLNLNEFVISIVEHIDQPWSFGKESANTDEFGFKFMKTKIEFSIVLNKKRLKKLTSLHIKAMVKDGVLYIPVDASTHAWIITFLTFFDKIENKN